MATGGQRFCLGNRAAGRSSHEATCESSSQARNATSNIEAGHVVGVVPGPQGSVGNDVQNCDGVESTARAEEGASILAGNPFDMPVLSFAQQPG